MKDSLLDINKLLTSVASNTQGAFERFYNIYYDQVFRFAYYFLRDKEACREVVTDVFLAIWKSRHKLKDIINIETYLYIVVRNESTRYLNHRQETTYLQLDEISPQEKNIQSVTPEEKLVEKEIEAILSRTINELPEKCRLIFLMTREEGLKPKEIAEILSINESTVRVQIKIAIDKIISRLKPIFPNISFTFILTFL